MPWVFRGSATTLPRDLGLLQRLIRPARHLTGRLGLARGPTLHLVDAPTLTLPPGIRIVVRGDTWKVRATSIHGVQQACVTSAGRSPVRRIVVRVDYGRPPRGWVGAPEVRGLVASSFRLRGSSGCQVELRTLNPVDPAILLAGAVRMLRPMVVDVGASIALAPGLPASTASLAGYVHDVCLDPPERMPGDVVADQLLEGAADAASSSDRRAGEGSVHLRRWDIVVAPSDSPTANRLKTVVVEPAAGSYRWRLPGGSAEVYVDPSVHRPMGRRSIQPRVIGSASMIDGTLVIQAPDIALRIRGDVTSGDVHRLKSVSGLTVDDALPPQLRAQLAACGVVLAGPTLPQTEFPGDDLEWQVRSVADRREALRLHGPQAALSQWPSVSVVLVTHRDRFVDHAVAQLARLDYPNLQVVIGLHGVDIDPPRFAPLRERHELVLLPIESSMPFGSAMQTACQRAEGTVLTKVDDDDFYGPAHVWDLVLARAYSGAQLVGKALDWIRVEPEDCTVFRPEYPAEQYATFIAGGTMMISRADLDHVGGWRPVPKSIDRALIDRVHQAGGLVYRTHGLGYLYVRRGEGHTALARDEHFLTKTAQRWPGLLQHEVFGTAASS
jgi:hypothetical protein